VAGRGVRPGRTAGRRDGGPQAGALAAFEGLFFDVRGWPPGWVRSHCGGGGPAAGFADLGGFWRWLGHRRGAAVVDLALGAGFAPPGRPRDVEATEVLALASLRSTRLTVRQSVRLGRRLEAAARGAGPAAYHLPGRR
jgi:hypothetical protein